MTDIKNLDSEPQQQCKLEASEEEKPTESPNSVTMAEIEQPKSEQISSVEGSENGNKKGLGSISFSIWPPTQRTRDAVINRLIETLSSPSVLSKRYGVLPHDEASEAAKRIEEEAFAAAGSSASADEDGIEILQIYSKEISHRMLDTVKSRSAPADNPPSVLESKSEEAAADVSEESSSGEIRVESVPSV